MSSPVTDTSPAPSAPGEGRPRGVAYPLLWLAGIVAAGLVLRAWHLADPYQIEEFSAVAAVAERQGVPVGFTASAADPLVPVAGLDEVSRRSVIPYGIRDPHPLYHYLLYGVIQTLPIADWSLRLPSLVAGVLCVVIVFLLTRRLLGVEVALLAAAVVALDPVQVTQSWMARPYAVANLTCLLSFVALWGVLRCRSVAAAALCGLGYAVSLALTGYLSPVMLVAAEAHVGVVVYLVVTGRERLGARAPLAAGSLALAVALMAPEFGYWSQLFAWGRAHSDYLLALNPIKLLTLVWHNLALLGGLALAVVATAVVRWQAQGEEEATAEGGEKAAPKPAEAPADPLPENDDAVWLGRLWVFIPQLAAIVLAYASAQSIFQTRYLGFTGLGGAILLAYFATRDPSREVRLGVAAVLGLALLVLGFFPDYGAGVGLFSSPARDATPKEIVAALAKNLSDKPAEEGQPARWQEGDVLLVRAGLAEADFLRGGHIPEENREAVKRAVLAPLSTLYADAFRRPVVPLSLSHFRSPTNKTQAGDHFDPATYYDEALAAELRQYKRFRVTGIAPNQRFISRPYLACLVPWLADVLGKELVVARNRDEGSPDRYLTVKPGTRPEDEIAGLTKEGTFQPGDFGTFVHMVRPK